MKKLIIASIFLMVCGLLTVARPTTAFAVAPTTYIIPNPPNERLKDFTVVEDAGTWHAFAMSVCATPECTRPYSVIWHYVSRDLHTWTNLGVALAPRSGTIDSGDVWAPTIVRANGQWKMLYTAVQYQGNTAVQRIAVATSNDLQTWNRTQNNLVLDCSSLQWAYWDPSDPQGIGGDCRDPYVAWDNASQRWLMTVSTRMTDVWGAHPMVIGQVWSDDLQQWHEIGAIPSTMGWTAESSHFLTSGGQTYILWTKCPAGGTCLQWARADSMQGTFSPAQSVAGIETWAYASETIMVEGRIIIFHVGTGIMERELQFPSNIPSVTELALGTAQLQATITVPGVSLEQSPKLPGASFLIYRDEQRAGWNANEDLFIGSTVTDDLGRATVALPPGTYFLVSDENDYLPGHVLATYAPESFMVTMTIDWADVLQQSWIVRIAPRRWNIGTTTTTVQRSVVPYSAASSTGTTFSAIHDIDVIGVGMEDASMMLSNDNGATWWSWSGTTWETRDLVASNATLVSELQAHLATFPSGSQQLRWELFHNETAVPVAVDISLDAAPTTPLLVSPTSGASISTRTPAFTLRGSDPDLSSLIYVLQYCGLTCTTIESHISQAEWTGLQAGLASSDESVVWQSPRAIGNGAMQWRARSVDTGGSGQWSEWTPWSTMQLPATAGVSATIRVLSTSSVELSWTSVTPATAYIYYTDEVDHEFLTSVAGLQGSQTITDLEVGGMYDFSITMNDIYGQQASTHVVQQLPVIPTVITQSRAWADGAGVHIEWQTNQPTIGQVRHGAQVEMNSTVTVSESSTVHAIVLTQYTPGQTVYYQITGQGGTAYQGAVTSFLVPSMASAFELPVEPDPTPILRPMREPRRPR